MIIYCLKNNLFCCLETCNIMDVYNDDNKTDCQNKIDNFANSISNANVNIYNIYSVLQRCVLKALHIPIERNFTWRIGSDKVSQNYETTQDDMSPFITNVLNAKVPVLLYFGEADSVLSYISGQRFCERLGRRVGNIKFI
ncbi:unnamed protein product [Meloidogyne enterolobii]|uniref:Uncharacterized protein n=1 Tax=Meloidogyne enterolobii TaxID=390850 RepID=A0ACB0Z0V1_MELEN